MTMVAVSKADVGEASLDWLSALGRQVTPPDQTALNKSEIGRLTE